MRSAVTAVKDEFADGVEDVSEPCTISGGVAVLPGDADDAASLKAHADLALYLSKRSGRDRVNVYQLDSPGAELLPDLGLLSSQDARLRLAEKLIVVVEARDAYVGEHATAVASLVVAIGRNLGIAERDLRHLHAAGLLHDLGKIGIPDAVLRKPGPLNDAERGAHAHASPRSASTFSTASISRPSTPGSSTTTSTSTAAAIPSALAGEDIPLGSRIILVADAFNAMTTDRSYRQAIADAEALAELEAQRGCAVRSRRRRRARSGTSTRAVVEPCWPHSRARSQVFLDRQGSSASSSGASFCGARSGGARRAAIPRRRGLRTRQSAPGRRVPVKRAALVDAGRSRRAPSGSSRTPC